MKNKRNYILLPVLCLTFLLVIAGCNNATDDTYSSQEDTTVSDGGTVDNSTDDTDNMDSGDADTPDENMNAEDADTSDEDMNNEDTNTSEENSDADNTEVAEGVSYTNDTYGFTISLPDSWEGYTVIEDTWQSNVAEDNESGPQLSIRHPEWTEEVPRQDIPILVFTMDQWSDIEAEKYNVSAAPIPPTELNRNSTYVFALPPRYNFAYPEGYEEVEDIIAGEPVKTFEIE